MGLAAANLARRSEFDTRDTCLRLAEPNFKGKQPPHLSHWTFHLRIEKIVQSAAEAMSKMHLESDDESNGYTDAPKVTLTVIAA